MQTGIYRIHNTITGDKYVGSAVNIPKRWKQHRRQLRAGHHHSRFLQRAWNKYGADAFVFSVVGYCGRAELLKHEQRAINTGVHAFNMSPTAGSMLGYRFTDAQRAKLSESHKGQESGFKGKAHTAGAKEKNRRAHLGSKTGPRTDEQRARMSAAQQGRTVSPEQRARISATLTGRKQNPETIAKRVAKLSGRRMPAGFAEKQRQRMTGRAVTQATRAALGRARAALSDNQVRGIRAAVMAGFRQGNVAHLLGIPQPTVSQIHNRKRYAWVT